MCRLPNFAMIMTLQDKILTILAGGSIAYIGYRSMRFPRRWRGTYNVNWSCFVGAAVCILSWLGVAGFFWLLAVLND